MAEKAVSKVWRAVWIATLLLKRLIESVPTVAGLGVPPRSVLSVAQSGPRAWRRASTEVCRVVQSAWSWVFWSLDRWRYFASARGWLRMASALPDLPEAASDSKATDCAASGRASRHSTATAARTLRLLVMRRLLFAISTTGC